MAGALARLKAFAGTRNGKIAVGGTAVTGVVAAGLLARHQRGAADAGAADGGAAAGAAAQPGYLQSTGTSGANVDGPVDNTSGGGVDPGQLEDILGALQNATDAFNQAVGNQTNNPTPPTAPVPTPTAPVVTSNPAPAPAPPATAVPAPAPAARYYTVVAGDNLSKIAQRYYGTQNWQKIYNANKGVIGSNPNLIKPGQRLVIPY